MILPIPTSRPTPGAALKQTLNSGAPGMSRPMSKQMQKRSSGVSLFIAILNLLRKVGLGSGWPSDRHWVSTMLVMVDSLQDMVLLGGFLRPFSFLPVDLKRELRADTAVPDAVNRVCHELHLLSMGCLFRDFLEDARSAPRSNHREADFFCVSPWIAGGRMPVCRATSTPPALACPPRTT